MRSVMRCSERGAEVSSRSRSDAASAAKHPPYLTTHRYSQRFITAPPATGRANRSASSSLIGLGYHRQVREQAQRVHRHGRQHRVDLGRDGQSPVGLMSRACGFALSYDSLSA